MKLIGVSVGDPFSSATYSGVPFHLFQELERSSHMVGRLNARVDRWTDVFHGAIDLPRSLRARRIRRCAFWRYLPENIARLSDRIRRLEAKLPKHDAVLQFGVAGLPDPKKLLVAHVEISIQTATESQLFAKTYGFANRGRELLSKAIEGEREFLSQCDLIWTNTSWTAETFAREGVPLERFWCHPPACNMHDPGAIERKWTSPHILFVGKVWDDKGGPLLLEAFSQVKHAFPNARLTIIGCSPALSAPGVEVLGFLNKQLPGDCDRLREAYEVATVFCMPSLWESVGIVYMEAALYGLPVIMLKGQGRESVFPAEMAIHVESHRPQSLAEELLQLARNPTRAYEMGQFGRSHVLRNYTWPIVARRLMNRVAALKENDGPLL